MRGITDKIIDKKQTILQLTLDMEHLVAKHSSLAAAARSLKRRSFKDTVNGIYLCTIKVKSNAYGYKWITVN